MEATLLRNVDWHRPTRRYIPKDGALQPSDRLPQRAMSVWQGLRVPHDYYSSGNLQRAPKHHLKRLRFARDIQFIHLWLYSLLLDLGLFFSFLIFFTQSVGLLGGLISPSQGRYLHTGQHKHRINEDIHASSGVRIHDPSVREGEDNSCLRARGRCDRRARDMYLQNYHTTKGYFCYQ
jgi:hypothetical protein